MIKLNGCDLAERLDTIEIDSNIFLNRLFRHGINRFFSQTLLNALSFTCKNNLFRQINFIDLTSFFTRFLEFLKSFIQIKYFNNFFV